MKCKDQFINLLAFFSLSIFIYDCESACPDGGCRNNATCSGGTLKFCKCLPGFTGVDCGLLIDYCQSGPCQNGGSCYPHLNGYQCECSQGHIGPNCDHIKSIASPCHRTCPKNSACKHLNGTNFQCECNFGWKPPNCTKRMNFCDEYHVCENNGTCQPQPDGNYPICICMAGFTGKTCAFKSSDPPPPPNSSLIACHTKTYNSPDSNHCLGSWCTVIAGSKQKSFFMQPYEMGCTDTKLLPSISQGCYLVNSYQYCQCDFQSYCTDKYELNPSVYATSIPCCLNENCTQTINATYCIIANNSEGRIIYSYDYGWHGIFDWSSTDFKKPAILRQLLNIVINRKYCMSIASGSSESAGSTFICYCYGDRCNTNITGLKEWATEWFSKFPTYACAVRGRNQLKTAKGHLCLVYYQASNESHYGQLYSPTIMNDADFAVNFTNQTFGYESIEIQTSILMTDPTLVLDSTFTCMHLSLTEKMFIHCVCKVDHCNSPKYSGTTVRPRIPTSRPHPRPTGPPAPIPHYHPPPHRRPPDPRNFEIGISFGAVTLFVFCASIAVYWRKRYRKLRTERIVEMASVRSNETNPDNPEAPRKKSDQCDKWEVPRDRITVHEDKELGVGSFGRVYEGTLVRDVATPGNIISSEEDTKSSIKVAVKILPGGSDQISQREFHAEIELMKAIGNHAHVANLLGCVTRSLPTLLIIEYCSDGNLLRFLKNHRAKSPADSPDLSLFQLISFAWQISDGMEYISSKGFIHRDLAARNVLIHKEQIAKVCDFGLTRYPNSPDDAYLTRGGRLPLRWMPLEAIRDSLFSAKSDVWAFGVLLYELVTFGSVPYATVQPFEMEKHLEEGNRLQQPGTCPNNVYNLMLSCWARNPQDRPTFTELKKYLATMVEEYSENSDTIEYVEVG